MYYQLTKQMIQKSLKNNTIDFLGVNYYQPRRIKAKETEVNKDVFMPDWFFDNYEMPGRKNESIPWMGNLRKRNL